MLKTKILFSAAALLAANTGAAQTPSETTPDEITAPGPQGDLTGTYLAPEEGGPVVLIIPGSGPTDRDGNNPLGVTAASYRLLAKGLAKQGVETVRIDKRGMFGSAAAIPDANSVTVGDYADDVATWSTAIRAKTGADCIWVAGHSEGGLVALVAAQKPAGLCGIILLSAMGRPLGTILREQLGANPANAPLLPDAMKAIDALERGERVDISAMHPALTSLFAPQIQGFLIDAMARDPGKLAAATNLPMLIVQGDADLQVSTADAQALHAAQPESTLVILPGVNHLLKTFEGSTREANLASYSNPALPISPKVVANIADFVLAEHGED